MGEKIVMDTDIHCDYFQILDMGVYYVFIVSKSGGLIFNYDHNVPAVETEKTYSFPLDIQLKFENNRVLVAFGERDGVCIGHALLAVNGQQLTYKELPDGRDVFDVIADKANYPLNLKFGRPKITTNEKIVLASMFYPLFALAVQLAPDQVRLWCVVLTSIMAHLHTNICRGRQESENWKQTHLNFTVTRLSLGLSSWW